MKDDYPWATNRFVLELFNIASARVCPIAAENEKQAY